LLPLISDHLCLQVSISNSTPKIIQCICTQTITTDRLRLLIGFKFAIGFAA